MDELKKIKIVSLLGTIANVAEMVAGIIGLFVGMVFIKFADEIISGGENLVENGGQHDTVGGFEALSGIAGVFGGIVGALLGYAIVLISAFIIAIYIVPSIVGIVNFIKSKKRLAESEELYITKYKSDGILKAVFNGIPVVLMAFGIVDSLLENNLALDVMGLWAVLIALFALAIYQVKLCKKLLLKG